MACVPISASSQRQTVTADSTPFAELVAGHHVLKTKTIPVSEFFDHTVGKGNFRNVFREDNTAFIQCVKTGRNPTMRHLPKTAGIDIAQMHDIMGAEEDPHAIDTAYTLSAEQVADIHTKGFTLPDKWAHARKMCGVMTSDELVERIKQHTDQYTKLQVNLETIRNKRKKDSVKGELECSQQKRFRPYDEDPTFDEDNADDIVHRSTFGSGSGTRSGNNNFYDTSVDAGCCTCDMAEDDDIPDWGGNEVEPSHAAIMGEHEGSRVADGISLQHGLSINPNSASKLRPIT